MSASSEAWLLKFFAFFAEPSAERYAPLFHPEGELLDAGMAEPLPASRTGEAIRLVLSKLPDLKIEPVRHVIDGNRVFVEARNSGTLAGQPLNWGAVYRVHLKDGLVHRGRRFYDQAELFRPLLPPGIGLPAFTPVAGELPEPVAPGPLPARDFAARLATMDEAQAYAKKGKFIAPGLARPLSRGELPGYLNHVESLVPDLSLTPVDWVGGGDVVFVEWKGTGTYKGAPASFDRIVRYLIDEQGLITEARVYADTLALLERDHPEIARIRAGVIRS